MIIAIDGPAASGKSTLARALAQALGLTFLDTGAMYRAITWKALREGVDPQDAERCTALAEATELRFDDEERILVDGEPGEPHIRSAEVTGNVSFVARHSGVRRALVTKQREIAARRGSVAEGRDTTTVVFPEADHKFFLVASSAERARRRAAELGQPEREAAIKAEIDRRDEIDTTRQDSPLLEPADGTRIETDGRGPAEVLAIVLAHVERGGARG